MPAPWSDFPIQSWSSQTNAFNIDNYRFLAWHSALLGWGKDWLVQDRDNVIERDNSLWCWQPGVQVRQHYNVAMSVHCHKSVTLDAARTYNNKQTHSVTLSWYWANQSSPYPSNDKFQAREQQVLIL